MPPILVFIVVDLALTMIFLGYSSPSSHIGTLRPVASIAPKVLALATVGLGVGLIASFARRTLDPNLITFGIAFTTLLDLDHLPSVFGVEQPIRPAHTLTFLTIIVFLFYLVVARSRSEIPMIAILSISGAHCFRYRSVCVLRPIVFHIPLSE